MSKNETSPTMKTTITANGKVPHPKVTMPVRSSAEGRPKSLLTARSFILRLICFLTIPLAARPIEAASVLRSPTITVSVVAADSEAGEPGNNGTLTVTRTGSTTKALQVGFKVKGTAKAGFDYTTLGTSVTIPVGARSARPERRRFRCVGAAE